MKISLTLEASRVVLGNLIHWGIIRASDLITAGMAGDEINAVVVKAVDLGKVETLRDLTDKLKEFTGELAKADAVIYRGAAPASAPGPAMPRGYLRMPAVPAGMVTHTIDWHGLSDAEIYYQTNAMPSELLSAHMAAMDEACSTHVVEASERHLQGMKKAANTPAAAEPESARPARAVSQQQAKLFVETMGDPDKVLEWVLSVQIAIPFDDRKILRDGLGLDQVKVLKEYDADEIVKYGVSVAQYLAAHGKLQLPKTKRRKAGAA